MADNYEIYLEDLIMVVGGLLAIWQAVPPKDWQLRVYKFPWANLFIRRAPKIPTIFWAETRVNKCILHLFHFFFYSLVLASVLSARRVLYHLFINYSN